MKTGVIVCIIVMATSVMSAPNDILIRSTGDELDVVVTKVKRIQFDYQNRLVVYRFYHEEREEFGPCYAREMEDEETYIPRARPNIDDGEPLPELKATSRRVPGEMISKGVERLCTGVDIYWLEEYETDVIGKMGRVCIGWDVEYKCSSNGHCTSIRVCKGWLVEWK